MAPPGAVVRHSATRRRSFAIRHQRRHGGGWRPEADKMAATPGYRIVLRVAFVVNLLQFVFTFIAFASPSWFQSWPRVYSPFKRIGLWEACFAGLVLEVDPRQKAYHGCWWILSPEYDDIRTWLMPRKCLLFILQPGNLLSQCYLPAPRYWRQIRAGGGRGRG